MPTQLTAGLAGGLFHALFAGLVTVRYLWPVWLFIAILWLLTRAMRAVGRFFGFSSVAAKPAKPIARTRR